MNKSKVPSLLLLVAFVLLLTGPLGYSQEADEEEESATEEEIEEITVIGVRNPNRSASDSPVPVDVINSENLSANASVDMLNQLASEVPSFNIEMHPIADAATLIRPPNLRGLPADAALVLVNGKRRHRGAVVALLGGGKNQGTQGVDVTAIPAIAVDRVEVLRDGASAQYGSDAIAGVINFVLRESSDARSMSFKAGQHFEGDGSTVSLSGILGLEVGDGGFATISVEVNQVEPTVRSTQRDDARGLIASGNTFVRQPYAQIWGSPETHYDYRIFGNSEFPLDDGHSLYVFGNLTYRDVEGGFFYRNPNTRSGVFTIDSGATLLVANLGDDSSACPVVTIANQQVPDADALAAVEADPNCYSFVSKFPGGFTPQFGGEVSDESIAFGFRGEILNGWDYDTSFVWGRSAVDYYMKNTINPQLVDRQNDVPTEYRPGVHEEIDWVINYEMAKSIEVASGYSDLYLATGLEIRQEGFVTTQGEQDSWYASDRFAEQGFGIGSNGFAGFPPESEVDEQRNSWSLWIDAEQNLTSNILSSGAVRYEDFDQFGHNLDFKVSTRIDYTPNFAVRVAVSTGFAAPTVGQSNIRIVTTNFLISPICPQPDVPCLADEVTMSPTDPLAALKGGQVLQPARSVNTAIGLVFQANRFDVTLDYFRVNMKDRIARTPAVPLLQSDFDELEARGLTVDRSLSAIRFYTNDFDTRTEGLDLSVGRFFNWGTQSTDLTVVANYTKTTIEHRNPALITDQRVRELEEGYPRTRVVVSMNHTFSAQLSGLMRVRYYGELWEPHLFTDSLPVDVANSTLIDAEVQFAIDDNATIVAGVENILDTYPSENPHAGVAGATYPLTSAFGFNGGFAYLRMSLNLP